MSSIWFHYIRKHSRWMNRRRERCIFDFRMNLVCVSLHRRRGRDGRGGQRAKASFPTVLVLGQRARVSAPARPASIVPIRGHLRKTRSHFRKQQQQQQKKNTSLPSFSPSLPPHRRGEVFLGTLKEVFAQWDRLQLVSPH